jgi:hypothetical protein
VGVQGTSNVIIVSFSSGSSLLENGRSSYLLFDACAGRSMFGASGFVGITSQDMLDS